MSELKTLNDLKKGKDFCPSSEQEWVDYENLKQLAIKWAKREMEKIKSESEKKVLGHIGRFQVLCELFNIIEEDLMTNEEINNREHGEVGKN